MKKVIILVLTLFLAFLVVRKIKAEGGSLGISEPKCRSDFKSAGVYNESLGIYSLTCEAKVGTEYDCQHWRFDAITNKAECLIK